MTKILKRLKSSIREYKTASFLAPFFVMLEVMMNVLIPYIMAVIIDKGINVGDMFQIEHIGLILIIFCALSLIFGILSGKYAAIASSGFAANLRHDMFYNVQQFSFSNIDRFSTSSIVTRLTTDVTNVQNAYQMVIRIAIRAPLMLVCSFIMAFKVNAQLSLIFLIAMPILGAALFAIINYVHPIYEKVFKIYDSLNRVVQENLRGMRVVKAYVREGHEIKKFKNISENIYEDFTKAGKMLAFNMPVMQIVMYGCILLISWFGAKFIVSRTMTTGELMSMFLYAAQILISLMMMSMVFVMITMSRASSERIYELLEEKSDLTDCDNPIYDIKDGSIEFENVYFSYGKNNTKPVIDNVSVKIDSGMTVGIIGPTGSSKSSFVQLIPRLFDVTGGSVKVGGTDVRKYDVESLRNAVSMVLQKNELFSGTIKDNLKWGNDDATDEEIKRVCRLACVDEFVEGFEDGYDTFIEQGGSNVSGGQKQRLCIARALLKKPKILILDDSTSAVDTKTDANIRKAFAEEIPNTTKLIIAQRISSVQDSDMIIVFDDGKITACGKHDELMKNSEIYKEVYYSQMKGGDENE
jgi:ATP-binding cassette subfamily B protein